MLRVALRGSLVAVVASCGLWACGDDGAGTSAGTSSGGESSAGTSSGTSGASDGSSAGTSGSSGTGESTGSTTGGAEFCQGWEDAAGPAYLKLENRLGEALVPGATLPLECGPQGIFMFGLYPHFGGFTPASDQLEFTVVMDVEGFNLNPDGHFFSGPVAYYVGCEPILGGVVGVLPAIPWDEIPDPTVLDGKTGHVNVVMHAPGGDVTVDVDVTLTAVKDDGWAFCGG